MNMIVCALDVSKGYADLVITTPDDSVLYTRCLDDIFEGHQALMAMLRDAHARYPDAAIRCGAENTGGLERTWIRTLRVLARELPAMEVLALNPFAVTRMLEHQLHRAVTDKHSAQGIAHYLRSIANPSTSTAPVDMEGVRMLLGVVTHQVAYERELRTQLQSYLPIAFPELVPYCQQGLTVSVLRILQKYPSPRKLAHARLSTLAGIPHVTREVARKMMDAAKWSVTMIDSSLEACVVAEDAAVAIGLLAKKILAARKETKELEGRLIERMSTDPAFDVLVSITGVGKASAARIIAIIGNIARFPNSSKLIAYAGLDPMVRESGDKHAPRRISKRGNTHLRTVLFNDARSAIMYPGPLQDYYVRLRAAGKPYMVALVACMNKLLRIIYACWLSSEMFDPERHLEKGNQRETEARPVPKTQPVNALRHDTPKSQAPVSWREAKRRRTKQEREEETLLQEV